MVMALLTEQLRWIATRKGNTLTHYVHDSHTQTTQNMSCRGDVIAILHDRVITVNMTEWVKSFFSENATSTLLTLKVLVTTIDAQWEGMGDVGSARYEPHYFPRARP